MVDPRPAAAGHRPAESSQVDPAGVRLVSARKVYEGASEFKKPPRTPFLHRTVPLIGQARGYDTARFKIDLGAGLTVAALTLPSAMAYAELAGVPVTAGLYTLILPVLIFSVLTSSPRTVVGPEGTIALVTASSLVGVASKNAADYAAQVAALSLLVGLVFLLARLLRLGWISDYLSEAVLVGYITGVAIVIITGQLLKLTGISSPSDNALVQMKDLILGVDDASLATVLVGVGTLTLLTLLAKFLPRVPGSLCAVVGGIVVSWALDLAAHGVTVTGPVPAGLPRPSVPDVGWSDLVSLAGPALGIFVVAFSDGILLSRSFAAKRGETVDANQEMVAFSGGNIAAGLTGGIPIGLSGSRTAVNDAAGVTSQVSGVVNVAACTIVLLFLTGPIKYLPSAVLAAIIVFASVGLVDRRAWARIRLSSRTEVLIAVVTAVLVIAIGVLPALAVAVVLSVGDLIRRAAQPHDAVLGWVRDIRRFRSIEDYPDAAVVDGIVVYRLDDRFFFANAHYVRQRMLAAVAGAPQPVDWLVFDVAAVPAVDASSAATLRDVHAELKKGGTGLALAQPRGILRRDLAQAGLLSKIGLDNVYPTVKSAVEGCAAKHSPGRTAAGDRPPGPDTPPEPASNAAADPPDRA